MSNNIVQFNEEIIKGQIKELVRGSVEETLNELLEAEAEKLTQAARYERSEARQGYRSGHYDRNLTTTSGNVTLHVLRLKGISFETAIIERYRRRESSVEEALVEGEDDCIANMSNIAALIHSTFGFWWTGFYVVKGDELVLGPFQGPVACSRIPFGRGVCGTAWKRKESIVVPDVEQFPGHIACSSLSRSEIVVPVFLL